jgi:hypothetical protein
MRGQVARAPGAPGEAPRQAPGALTAVVALVVPLTGSEGPAIVAGRGWGPSLPGSQGAICSPGEQSRFRGLPRCFTRGLGSASEANSPKMS